MVDTGLIIEGIHVSIEIYKRIKGIGKLPKKLEGLESHVGYIEGILLDEKFLEKLKAKNYPRLEKILEEFRGIVYKAFPDLSNRVDPERKSFSWYAEEFIRVNGDKKRCDELLSNMDAVILRFSNALAMENFEGLEQILHIVTNIQQLCGVGIKKGHDTFSQSNAKTHDYGKALVVTNEGAQKQFYGSVEALHNREHSLSIEYGNAEAKGHSIAVSTSSSASETVPLMEALNKMHTSPSGKSEGKKKEKKKEQRAKSTSSSSSSSSQRQESPSKLAPGMAIFSPAVLQIEGIYLEKVSENKFRVIINYPRLRLDPMHREVLQALLTGADGEQAYNYIENSSIKDKKGNITELSFEDEGSAAILIGELTERVRAWKAPAVPSGQEEGVTPISKQF